MADANGELGAEAPGGEPDIYEFWRECRRDEPVKAVEGLGQDLYFVTRHADVERVLRDSERFSSRVNADTMGPVMGEVILAMDGDEHRRYRNLVASAFRPSAMARWADSLVRPAIDRLVDALGDTGCADLVSQVTAPYPVEVIAGVLGVPFEDHEQFHRWAQAINLGPEDYPTSTGAAGELRDYLRPIVEDRRARRRDDLVSDLVHAEVDGERLREELVYGFLLLLLPAGAETTYRAMGNCLLALLTHPDVLARARDDESMLDRVIDETLRWETSVTMVNRETTHPTELAGSMIPAGASIVCATGSANRDESRYEEPDGWDVERDRLPHLAFGTGRHQCLGMHLARMELRIGLATLLRRLPRLRLDPDTPPTAIEGMAFRSPPCLAVCFDPPVPA
jgi:cytochrome P450